MAKQHDHDFEMMAIVAIVAVVGLIIMFMNTGKTSTSENLVGQGIGAPTCPPNSNCEVYCEEAGGWECSNGWCNCMVKGVISKNEPSSEK